MYDGITIILIILIVGIILDGIRRMRNARRDGIKISRNAKKADKNLGESKSHNEFPSGGARVVAYRDAELAQDYTKSVRQKYSSTRVTMGASNRIPEQVALNLEESVPMLMESVQEQSRREQDADLSVNDFDEQERAGATLIGEERTGYESVDDDYQLDTSDTDNGSSNSDGSPSSVKRDVREKTPDLGRDPVIGDLDGLDDMDSLDGVNVKGGAHSISYDGIGDAPVAYQPVDDRPLVDKQGKSKDFNELYKLKDNPIKSGLSRLKGAARSADIFLSGESHKTNDTASVKEDANKTKVVKTDAKIDSKAESGWREPDEVIVFNLMAKSGYVFDGEELLYALIEEGMKLGDMDIFHRYYEDDGDAPVLFSLANMVVPGTFNLSKMIDFTTPGVSMFLSLPIATESIAAYDILVATATNLAKRLDGDLKDENRSILTKQTIEHARQRVVEYERKRKLAKV